MEFRLDSQLKWRLAAAGSGLAPRTPYRLGERADVAAALPDAVELWGWSAIEDNGAWSDGPETHVDVTMSADARGRALDVILWLDPFSSAAGGQRVRIHAGGETLGMARLNGPTQLRLPIPIWNDPRRPVRLSFELPDCATPESLGLGNDRRRLAVKLSALAILRRGEPAPDPRLDYSWGEMVILDGAAEFLAAEAVPVESVAVPVTPAALPAPVASLMAAQSVVRLGAASVPGVVFSGFESGGGDHGRWTLARQASLQLAWSEMPVEPLAVDLLVAGFVPGHHGQDISFICDDLTVGRLLIDGGDVAPLLVRVPVSGTGSTIALSLPLATSPRAEGESIDDRLLGLRLIALKVGPRRHAPVSALRPAGSAFADFTAIQGIIAAGALPRSRGGLVARLRGALLRRAEGLREFFTGGIDSRTRMAAQMSGDVLRAIDAMERSLDGRNEALAEALRSASEAQSRQLAGRLSDFRADLDMRVASINAAISGLASRQSDIEQGVASLLHPQTGAFTQVTRALGASSDALKTGFGSLSASMRRAMNVQAGQHDDVVGGLGEIRLEFAALEEDLRARLSGSASALKAGFGSLAESLRRNLQTNTGGFSMLGDEAAAMRERLAEMETALSEHVSGAASQMRAGLSQLLGAADQGQRYDELKTLIATMQESGSSDQVQRTRALTLLSGEISAFKSEIEGRISLLGDTTRQFSGTALQMLHAQQDALGEATTRLGVLSEGAGKPLSELAELKSMLARTADRIESSSKRDARLLVSAHEKLDASAHRLLIDLDAQTKAIRTVQGFLLVPRLDARLLLMLIESAGAYEPGLSALMGKIVKPGMRVADVGANIGFHTLHLARLVGPRGWVSAVEPIPDLARILQRMLSLNNVDAHSEVVLTAAGSPAREQRFNIGMTSGHSSLFPVPGSTGSITVNVRELDAIVPPGTVVDFVKIDAEGAEREVFTGMSGLLRNPDISIAMEFAPSLLRRAGVDPADLLHDIARAGFETFLIGEPDGRLLPIAAEPLLAVSGCNIFLVRKHTRDWALAAGQDAGLPS